MWELFVHEFNYSKYRGSFNWSDKADVLVLNWYQFKFKVEITKLYAN